MLDRLKSLFAAKPPPEPVEFRHADFGVLTGDSGIWSGEAEHRGRRIRFFVGGTETMPDAGLMERVREVLGRFTEVERRALDFLAALDTSVRAEDFEFYSLEFLWEERPDLYTLEFTMAGDVDGIWRVEFEGDLPRATGRDD